MRSVRMWGTFALLSLAVTIASLAGALSWSASGASPDATLSVDPAAKSVNAGDTFTVTIKQNAAVASLGAQFTFTFDPTQIQIPPCASPYPAPCSSVQPAAALTGAAIYGGVAPQHISDAVVEANSTGVLKNVAGFFSPGSSTLAAGDITLFTITLHATATASGTSNLGLTKLEVLGTDGNDLANVVSTGSLVTVTGAVATTTPTPNASGTVLGTATATLVPTETATPFGSVTATATQTATATETATTTTPTSTATVSPTTTTTATRTSTPTLTATATWTVTPTTVVGSGSVDVVPTAVVVGPDTEFTMNINQSASFTTTGTQTNVTFDTSLLQVDTVERAPAFTRSGGAFLLGVVKDGGAQQTAAEAIAEANTTGVLKNVTAYYLPGTNHIDSGENSFLIVKFKSTSTEGSTAVGLTESEMLDLDGNSVNITAHNGNVTVQVGAPTPVAPTPAVAAVTTPVSVSGTPRASTSSGAASRTNSVAGATASPKKLPSTGDGLADGGLQLISLIAATLTFLFGGLTFAAWNRERAK